VSLVQTVLAWGRAEALGRGVTSSAALATVIKYVRFPWMSTKDLYNKVSGEPADGCNHTAGILLNLPACLPACLPD
jgi:hypothetical protein